jgi:Tol biopolymer transport system component
MVALLALTISVTAVGAATAEKRPAERVGTIAFVSDRTGEDEVHLLHLKSMKSSRLTRNPQGPDRAPAWSPNGEALAFNSRRKPDPSQPDIHVINIASGAVDRVTQTPLEEQRAAWTQDGRFVVYQRGDFSAGFELWRTNLETGREKRLTKGDGSASFDVAPDPSPVSDLLLLQTNRGADGLFPFQIGVLEPGSKTPAIIPLKLKGSVDGPRWSPDGRKIVFAADGEIYVMNSETRRLRRLTDDRHQDLSPDWSPDGDAIVFQSDRRVRSGGLHVMDLETAKVSFLREGRTPVWTATEHARTAQ